MAAIRRQALNAGGTIATSFPQRSHLLYYLQMVNVLISWLCSPSYKNIFAGMYQHVLDKIVSVEDDQCRCHACQAPRAHQGQVTQQIVSVYNTL